MLYIYYMYIFDTQDLTLPLLFDSFHNLKMVFCIIHRKYMKSKRAPSHL